MKGQIVDAAGLLMDLNDDDAGVTLAFTYVWHNRATGQHGKGTQFVDVDWTSNQATIQQNVTATLKAAILGDAKLDSWPNNSRFKLLGI